MRGWVDGSGERFGEVRDGGIVGEWDVGEAVRTCWGAVGVEPIFEGGSGGFDG